VRRFRLNRPRAWPAALAALVLLLQGLIPAAALAHDHPGLMQICTRHGPALASVQSDPHHRFGGLACEQCVMASFAALAAALPPPPAPTAWTYEALAPAAPAAAPLKARAPPRPPSRAPPVLA
jgi:hypothetical protein